MWHLAIPGQRRSLCSEVLPKVEDPMSGLQDCALAEGREVYSSVRLCSFQTLLETEYPAWNIASGALKAVSLRSLNGMSKGVAYGEQVDAWVIKMCGHAYQEITKQSVEARAATLGIHDLDELLIVLMSKVRTFPSTLSLWQDLGPNQEGRGDEGDQEKVWA